MSAIELADNQLQMVLDHAERIDGSICRGGWRPSRTSLWAASCPTRSRPRALRSM